jgi:ribonuclease BN (tRNA processing enzyme)
VLGKSPAWQDVDGACSGYLVEHEGFRLLLDCGCGVFAKLRRFADYTAVDAIVISHLHADHFLDLVPFSYALIYAPHSEPPRHPALYAPPGARDCFRRVTGAWGDERLIEKAFEVREYDPAAPLAAGPLQVRFQPVPHVGATHAVEVRAATGGRLTFSADGAPSEALWTFAHETDLLLIEATLPEPEPDEPRVHMTAAEAGEHGRKAGARRLVLTHLTDELDAVWARQEAERAFGGPVAVAQEGAVYEL